LTKAQKEEFLEHVQRQTCKEWQADQLCVRRKSSTKMIGNKHAGCLAAELILQLLP
jgi:hypothetical protein